MQLNTALKQVNIHSGVTLLSLYWLPVRQRIIYKLCPVMHSVVHGQAPSYIYDIVMPVTRLPGRANLRSAHQSHYDVPHVATGLGQRSFAVAGPKTWNSLPSEQRCIAVDSTFMHRLKAELFSRAYGVSINI